MKAKKVVILGYGMQGQAALHDLVTRSDVSEIIVADNRADLDVLLKQYPVERVKPSALDATDREQLSGLMTDADLVLEFLPGKFAFAVGQLAAELGVNLVSSMYYVNPGEEDPVKVAEQRKAFEALDRKAKEKGITILTEFGMDPGLDLVLGAKALSEFDEVSEFYSYGAGFPAPEFTDNPLKYKFTWSIIGVMFSYLRPAKVISGGGVREVPAREMFSKDNMHLLDVPEIGRTLECFPNGNTNHYAELFGLKETIREMGRYICRWEGHGAFWEVMAKSGFLDQKPVRVGNCEVVPAEFCAALLASQDQFFYREHEQDMALVRMDVRGRSEGKNKRVIYQLIDRRDLETGFTAMQRTVGFTASIGCQLILNGEFKETGVVLPMKVPFELVEREIGLRGMTVTREEFLLDE
ncbi:MAG TPA: saccharopine dehydrogenase C-terminal domain-containing protein [Synergistales bacterium]|nr:saccharopine dehydrogenase C-terminal domain-containing protein [Synergistales bacterium]